jgi:subtilisin-like proprotein convertase family protein
MQNVLLGTLAPISITGQIRAPRAVQTLTASVDTITLYSQTWASGAVTETAFALSWAPFGEGVHAIKLIVHDWLTGTAVYTSHIILDTQAPFLTLATDIITSTHYYQSGRIELSGQITDAGGIAALEWRNTENTWDEPGEWQMAEVSGTTWTASWLVDIVLPQEGAIYPINVRATDVAGRVTLITETLTLDVEPPTLGAPTITFDGAPAIEGQTLLTPTVRASVSLSETADGGGPADVWHGWTETYTATQAQLRPYRPGSIILPLVEDFTATDGVARYFHLLARDALGNTATARYGPFYHDPLGAPTYLSLSEPAGPYSGQPYGGWRNDFCTLAGVDSRVVARAAAESALNQAQQFYYTWDHEQLAFSWLGADWDVDGDLFIYLDTRPDQLPDGQGLPYVRHGGNIAYNPYTSTAANTLMLLPGRSWDLAPTRSIVRRRSPDQGFSSQLPFTAGFPTKARQFSVLNPQFSVFGSQRSPLQATQEITPGYPPRNALNAEYAVWIPDRATAILLRWDDENVAWVRQSAPITGTAWLNYHFTPGDTPITDLFVPFDILSVTTPLSTSMRMVAFATEEDALRTWAVMPPTNPANSGRVVEYASLVGEPHRFALIDWYTLALQNNQCSDYRGRLNFSISSSAGGLNLTFTDDETRLRVMAVALPYTLFAEYGSAYTAWMDEVYCPEHPTHRDCHRTKQPIPAGPFEALQGLKGAYGTPVQPGERVTYTLHYKNELPVMLRDMWAIVNTGGADITWPNQCPLIPWGDVLAAGEGAFHFSGRAGPTGIAGLVINIYPATAFTELEPDTCTYTLDPAQADNGMTLALVHTPDMGPPNYLIIQEPRTFIGPEQAIVRGAVLDASPVATVTLEVEAPGGSVTTLTCPDATPTDGAWTCPWDVAATHDGTMPPTEGDRYRLRARATDPFGYTSAWTPWQTLAVDSTPPDLLFPSDDTLTPTARTARAPLAPLTPGAIHAITDTVFTANQFELSGELDDNRLPESIEICNAQSHNCDAAEILLDTSTIPEEVFTYEDAPTATIPITTSTSALDAFCGTGNFGLARQFVITESVSLASVDVGVNLIHPYRSDISITLVSPAGTAIALAGSGDALILAQDYDVRFTEAAEVSVIADTQPHDIAPPYYDTPRLPLVPLSQLYGESAAGTWRLIICDSDPTADSGSYQRAQLRLTTDTLPEDTRARWRYSPPDMAGRDGEVITRTLSAIDSVGNRSSTPAQLSFTVDNVAPVLTVTQLVTQTPYMTNIVPVRVLQGSVSDGNGVNEVYITLQTPWGVLDYTPLPLNSRVRMSTDMIWHYDLTPFLAGAYKLWVNTVDIAGNLATEGVYTVDVRLPMTQVWLPLIAGAGGQPTGAYGIWLPLVLKDMASSARR